MRYFTESQVDLETGGAVAISGEKQESVSSASVTTTLLSTLVEQNEVKAVFVGHDHVNQYCIKRQGIQLCYGGGGGFGRAYGSDTLARRVRVIEWSRHENGIRTIRRWKRHHDSINQVHHPEVLYQDDGLDLTAFAEMPHLAIPHSNARSASMSCALVLAVLFAICLSSH